jgi:Ca2+:H+ antiporter
MVVEILGSCFFFASWGKATVSFNIDVTSIMSLLMIISSASFIVTSALYSTFTSSESLDPEHSVLVLSYNASIIPLILYIIYFYFQLKSHNYLFKNYTAAEANESYELGPWGLALFL